MRDRKKDRLLSLYYQILRIRLVEEKIAELYPEQEMRCPVHLCIGHEASAVAVCSNLDKTDYVVSTHRSHGHYLAKGGSLKAMIAELYGKITGCSKGFGGSMHLTDLSAGFICATPIVANSIPVAVGMAFKIAFKNENRISVAFFGDAGVEEGVFHESANFASLHNLPVLFVCENNLYAVNTVLRERQPKRNIFKLAEPHKIKARQLDGNDIFLLDRKMSVIIGEIKKTRRPQFVEVLTYRYLEHCGPNYDIELGYRSKSEFVQWKKKDPIERARNILFRNGSLTEKKEKSMINRITKEIEEAFRFAKKSPFPNKSHLGKFLYAD